MATSPQGEVHVRAASPTSEWTESTARRGSMSGAIRRIRQACTHCRHRKTKCSGEKPRCKNCQRVGRNCHYEPYSHTQPSSTSGTSQATAFNSTKLPSAELHPELLKRINQIESQLALLSDQGSANSSMNFVTLGRMSQSPPTLSSENPSINVVPGPRRASSLSPRRRLSQGATYKPEPNLGSPDAVRFSTLPPHSVVQSLIDTYFQHAYNQPYSYFQEESFREKLAYGLLPKCLIFAVLASALRFSDNPYFKWAKQQATEAYAREAWLSVLNDHMTAENCPNVHVAQTTNILAIIDFTGWLKIGLSVRIAQDLELMEEPSSTFSIVEQEERRRTFWSIYLLDKLVSCGRSRPPAIADEDCRVSLPCDEEAFRQGSFQKTATLYQVSNWTADSDRIGGNFALTILAASALGRCARYVLHQRDADELAPWDQRSEFASINTYLLLVSHHLRIESTSVDDIAQAHMKPDGSLDYQDAAHVVFSFAVFHLCYCLLNHPILLRLRVQKMSYRVPPNFLRRSLQTSCEHASNAIELVHKASAAGFPIRPSFYAYATTVAGSIIMMAIRSGEQSTIQMASELQEKNQQALMILEEMGRVWEHASKMHIQLLLFDASDVASAINLDANATADLNPGLEEVLWPIVDYGLMCGSLAGQKSSVKPLQQSIFDEDANCFPTIDLNEDIEPIEGFMDPSTGTDHLMPSGFSMPNLEYMI
uniref:Zn(2)-C6 fungal-type domain-containing protein n=1 Tax=Bionectria ochroleuca TaxID=29856 RepID=A0A0B7JNG1_BIOOC